MNTLADSRTTSPVMSSGLAWSGLAILLLASILQHGWYWTQLPEEVAIHFGAGGQPDDWASRNAATGLLLSLQVLMPLVLVGISHAMAYLPVSLINMPNREYWLVGERRPVALRFMQNWMMGLAALTCLLMMGLAHMTFLANVRAAGLNTNLFLLLLGSYLGMVLGMVVLMYRRFRLPRE